MKVVRFGQAPTFEPAGHHGVLNRALVSQTWQGVDAVSVWHGSFEADGSSDLHVHEQSVQVYVVLTGAFVVGTGAEQHRLEVNDTVIISAGEPHSIAAADGAASVLVVSAPALR